VPGETTIAERQECPHRSCIAKSVFNLSGRVRCAQHDYLFWCAQRTLLSVLFFQIISINKSLGESFAKVVSSMDQTHAAQLKQ